MSVDKTAFARSRNNDFTIEILNRDYGGSIGGCEHTYEEGNSWWKYTFGKSCGGMHIEYYLVSEKYPFTVYELKHGAKNFPCGPEGVVCGGVAIEEVEPFELTDHKTVIWYGEEIEYK
jgi:hypothetical protein